MAFRPEFLLLQYKYSIFTLALMHLIDGRIPSVNFFAALKSDHYRSMQFEEVVFD